MKLPIAAAIISLSTSNTVNARIHNDETKKDRELRWGPSKNMVKRSLASPAITEIRGDIVLLKAANVTAVTAIATANAEIAALQDDVVLLEAANVTAVTAIATANAEIAALQDDVVLLEAANVTVNARLEAAEATISAAVATISELTSLVRALTQRIVFTTRKTYRGDALEGILGAHLKCQTLAIEAGLSGTFKAWLSSSTSWPAKDFVKSELPYVNTNGDKVADDWQDLITYDGSGYLDIGIAFDEKGVSFSGSVWTGTDVTGMPESAGGTFCGDWTSSSTSEATTGFNRYTLQSWTDFGLAFCSQTFHLYCFEQ